MTEPETLDHGHVSGIDLAVVGASAGGVGTLEGLVGRLPADLGVATLVVLHVPSSGVSLLAEILDRACRLPVRRARDGMDLDALAAALPGILDTARATASSTTETRP